MKSSASSDASRPQAAPSHYQTLGVKATADASTIKAAYRQLARAFHPDLNPSPEAEERFKAINQAYEVLRDPQKKAAYDARQKQPAAAAPSRPVTPTAPPKATPAKAPASNKAAAGFGDMLEAFFKRPEAPKNKPAEAQSHTPSPKKPPEKPQNKAEAPSKKPAAPQPAQAAAKPTAKRGDDLELPLLLTPEEAQSGCVKTVALPLAEFCQPCSATGRINGRVCPHCEGHKRKTREKRLEVRLPAGVQTGSKVRIAKEGQRLAGLKPTPGDRTNIATPLQANEPGDLFLLIQVGAPPGLRIEGLTVHSVVPITLPQAVLGTTVEVTTLWGTVQLHINAGTTAGQIYRLKGQGAAAPAGTTPSKGDHWVTMELKVPKTLSAQERAHYQALAALETP